MLYNENFGKLRDQNLEYAPLNIEWKHVWYCPAPDNVLKSCGYKKIVEKPYPEDGHNYAAAWKETQSQIVRQWILLPDPTAAQKREAAYKNDKICKFGNGIYTVDEMNKFWYEYSAEGDKVKVKEIKNIIVEAKTAIREKYPDK